jgi:hypothetical protein
MLGIKARSSSTCIRYINHWIAIFGQNNKQKKGDRKDKIMGGVGGEKEGDMKYCKCKKEFMCEMHYQHYTFPLD